MSARKDRVVHLLQHLDRLEESVRETRLSSRMRPDGIAEAIHRTVKAADLPTSRIRVTITGAEHRFDHGG